MTAYNEIYRLADPAKEKPRISIGLPFQEACANHVRSEFNSFAVYIIVSASIARTSNNLTKLEDAIGKESICGVRKGIRQHTPLDDIVEIVNDARAKKADLIVTLGAGSITDGAKAISFALANDITTIEELQSLMIGSPNAPRNLNACKIPIINIPTSLAGGEYTCGAGATNLTTLHKGGFYHPSMGADLVILDPALSITTPRQVWISTGIRSIDHCVEALCSTHSTDASDLTAAAGLRLLVNGLLQTNSSWGDMKAREDCMMGVIESAKGLNQNMPMGGSHAIGHQLGPLGMGQGETSCILLPAVTKYNAKHGDTEVLRRQEKVLEILWGEEQVQRLLNSKGFEKGKVDLSSALAAFIEELGMPQSLKNFGIGREDLDQLAEGTLLDPWSKTNPVPLLHKEQVLEILEMV